MMVWTNLLFNSFALAVIAFIVWWFWLAKTKQVVKVTAETVEIKVADGIYNPNTIEAVVGSTVTLRFLREDETPCAEFVIFDTLNVSAKLPLHQPHILSLKLDKKGEFGFACQMGMYRGTLIVE